MMAVLKERYKYQSGIRNMPFSCFLLFGLPIDSFGEKSSWSSSLRSVTYHVTAPEHRPFCDGTTCKSLNSGSTCANTFQSNKVENKYQYTPDGNDHWSSTAVSPLLPILFVEVAFRKVLLAQNGLA